METPELTPSISKAKQILEHAFGTRINEALFRWKVSRPGARLHLSGTATLTSLDLSFPGMNAITIYDWASTAPGASFTGKSSPAAP
jgi:hypothetical protein